MNSFLKQLTDSTTDAMSFTRSLVDSGVKSVSKIYNGIPIFGSLSALTEASIERDETHYILVPVPDDEVKYAVYSKRVLPPDVGAVNSLPKARVFHVPGATGKVILESKLVASTVDLSLSELDDRSDFAETLEAFADRIDRDTAEISGGLVIIGSAITFFNPILGVGVMASSLLPGIGGKASKAGADYIGTKLRKWNRDTEVAKLEKQAGKDVKKLKPEIFENPIIRSMDAVITNSGTEFDPMLDSRNWADEFEHYQNFSVTTEAISEIYGKDWKRYSKAIENPVHLNWIKHLMDLADQ